MKLELQNHDGRALLEVTAASFSSLAEYRRIQLTVILPPEPLFGRFDGDKLEKILYNLLSNAFKFTPEGGQITLEALSLPAANGLPKHLRIIVRDSGEGIPADQLPLVFERFFQGSPSYRGDAQGTGIGLALTRELVQLHGGTIRAESMPGQGATFVVDIPLVEPLWEAMPAEESEKVRPALEMEEYAWLPVPQNTTAPEYAQAAGDDSLPLLLIVEDNADLRQYIRQHLEDQYRVLEADNGLHGWETAVRHVPDLIISDWMMPGINGAEVCRRVKTDERTSHIPFLLLTALATEEGKLTGLENGADDYLTKPFDARELELRVRNLVQTRRKLRERFSRELRLQPKDITVTSADEKFMEKVLAVVEAHLGDADFGVEQFGREVGLSRMQLHRKLTALTGQTTSDFIRTMRLKRAAQLLEVQAATVSEVAFSVGFGSLSYFTRSFRGQFGVNPTEYSARKAAQSQ
jgi:DNA-binding response OmpR family regulator/two-component sensor histidine kinase